MGNQVTVTTTGAEGNGYSESDLVAKLDAGDQYDAGTFDGKDMRVMVVSSDLDGVKARVRISKNVQEIPPRRQQSSPLLSLPANQRTHPFLPSFLSKFWEE